jgi:hypothetical protein
MKFRIVKYFDIEKDYFIVQKKYLFYWSVPDFFTQTVYMVGNHVIRYTEIEDAEEAIQDYLYIRKKPEIIKEICTD